jgi:hypothetical protein
MPDFELTLLGDTRTVESVDLPAEISPHTNRPLAHVRLNFTVGGREANDVVVEALAKADAAEHALQSPDGRRWLVIQNRWSHTDARERYEHEVEVREAEALDPTHLEISGVILSPERYSETIVDGLISVDVIVAPDTETDRALEDLIRQYADQDDDYCLELKRVGISEEPISVKLSQAIFERIPDGRRHLLGFVQAGEEPAPGVFWRLNQPELSRMLEAAAAGTRAVTALVEELVRAGVFDDEASARVREALRTDNLRFDDRRPFMEVRRGLDDYFE